MFEMIVEYDFTVGAARNVFDAQTILYGIRQDGAGGTWGVISTIARFLP
jgi:hypothetical protein